MRMDTQTRSAHLGELSVLDMNDRAKPLRAGPGQAPHQCEARGGEGDEPLASLPLRAHVAFSAGGGPRSAPACHAELWILSGSSDARGGNGGGPPQGVGGRSSSLKMAGDVCVARLICSSGRDTEGWGDHRPDQSRLADSGRAAIGSGANLKIPVYASRPDFFSMFGSL